MNKPITTALRFFQKERGLPTPDRMTIEEMIEEINYYGVVTLMQNQDEGTWRAYIQYHSITPGVTAEASCQERCPTAQAALADALSVVRNAFAEIGREVSR